MREALLPRLWADQRRKHGDGNQVLSGGRANAPCWQARTLWCQARYGQYLHNATWRLRRGESRPPVYEASAPPRNHERSNRESLYWEPLVKIVARLEGLAPCQRKGRWHPNEGRSVDSQPCNDSAQSLLRQFTAQTFWLRPRIFLLTSSATRLWQPHLRHDIMVE